MAMITKLRHFLNDDDEVADSTSEARGLLHFLAAVVEAATLAVREPITFANVQCPTIVDEERCDGDIEVWLDPDDDLIGWECLECGEEGVISNWERTAWDRRDYVVH